MKSNYKVLGMVGVLAISLTITAFSQENHGEKKKEGNKQAGGEHHSVNAPQHTAQQAHQNQVPHAEHVQNQSRPNPNAAFSHPSQLSHGDNHAAQVQNATEHHVHTPASSAGNQNYMHGNQAQASGNPQFSNGSVRVSHQSSVQRVNPQSAQSGNIQRGARPQITPNGQYNSSNNYGGYWSQANTHNDWSHNGRHYWNDHNYRWYQGGWLIIDAGFNPYYVNTGYGNYASPVSSVQASLANLGYYDGPIDGDAGPGTRNAIASYQNDHNLNVTGRIDGDLLQSLQLE